jgi:hypothetical protein
MDNNKQTVSGIPLPPIDPAQLQDNLQSTMSQGAQAGAPTLETFTAFQQRRATRMTAIAGALGAVAGTTNADVVAIQGQVEAISVLKTHVETQAQRVSRWPKPRPNEWIVFGTVTNADGSPAPGLRVRIFDKDRKYDDLLGDTESDVNGDFWATYHARDFQETGENFPDLYVMVTDASGAVVYSSRDNVRYEAGRSEYFDIRLGARPSPVGRRKAPVRQAKTTPKVKTTRKPKK